MDGGILRCIHRMMNAKLLRRAGSANSLTQLSPDTFGQRFRVFARPRTMLYWWKLRRKLSFSVWSQASVTSCPLQDLHAKPIGSKYSVLLHRGETLVILGGHETRWRYWTPVRIISGNEISWPRQLRPLCLHSVAMPGCLAAMLETSKVEGTPLE